MKNVDKVVKNRIEKHLDIVEHNKAYYTEAEVLNTSEVLPVLVGEEEKDTDFRYARENMYHIIERGRDAMDELESVRNGNTNTLTNDHAVSVCEWMLFGNPLRPTTVGPNADYSPGRIVVDT